MRPERIADHRARPPDCVLPSFQLIGARRSPRRDHAITFHAEDVGVHFARESWRLAWDVEQHFKLANQILSYYPALVLHD
jgi:hypothetical protein